MIEKKSIDIPLKLNKRQQNVERVLYQSCPKTREMQSQNG